jgi:hypothetical protein
METTLEGHYSYGRLIRSSVPLVTMMIVCWLMVLLVGVIGAVLA